MSAFELERAISEWKRALRRNPALEEGQARSRPAFVTSTRSSS
jgi:hypothetical protein